MTAMGVSDFAMGGLNLVPLLPEIFLALAAMGFLLAGAFRGNESTGVLGGAAVVACAIAAALLVLIYKAGAIEASAAGGMLWLDGGSAIMRGVILIGVMAALLAGARFAAQEGYARFEYPVLVLLAGLGMMLMIGASHMLSVYMALELQSLSLYVLAAFNRRSPHASEAGVKYFTLGAVSSGMLLFGISLVYGFTGALDFDGIHQAASVAAPPLGLVIGMVFVLAGIAFKISAAPFHMWTPDVYEGAPGSVTAFFAIVPKVAAMILLMHLLWGPFEGLQAQWSQIVLFLSVVSMAVGALGGIAQQSLKRLLAYSSIGNMGYVLIGVLVMDVQAAQGVIFYLLIYMAMTAGTFAILLSLRVQGHAAERLEHIAGLSTRAPLRAYGLAALMFSMAGIPPLAGFFAKFFIFKAAAASGLFYLAAFGLVTSVIAAYYYLRVVKVMFFDEAPAASIDPSMGFGQRVVALVALAFVLFFALGQGALSSYAETASACLSFKSKACPLNGMAD